MVQCFLCKNPIKITRDKHYRDEKTNRRYHIKCLAGFCEVCDQPVNKKTKHVKQTGGKKVWHYKCWQSVKGRKNPATDRGFMCDACKITFEAVDEGMRVPKCPKCGNAYDVHYDTEGAYPEGTEDEYEEYEGNPGRPTREFWDKHFKDVKKGLKEAHPTWGKKRLDEMTRATLGSMWYKKMGSKAKNKYEKIRRARENPTPEWICDRCTSELPTRTSSEGGAIARYMIERFGEYHSTFARIGSTPDQPRPPKCPICKSNSHVRLYRILGEPSGVKENPIWVEKWDVPSETHPDKHYVVSKDVHGEYGCSCPHWTMRLSGTGGECKHIKALKMQRLRGDVPRGRKNPMDDDDDDYRENPASLGNAKWRAWHDKMMWKLIFGKKTPADFQRENPSLMTTRPIFADVIAKDFNLPIERVMEMYKDALKVVRGNLFDVWRRVREMAEKETTSGKKQAVIVPEPEKNPSFLHLPPEAVSVIDRLPNIMTGREDRDEKTQYMISDEVGRVLMTGFGTKGEAEAKSAVMALEQKTATKVLYPDNYVKTMKKVVSEIVGGGV